MTTTYSITSTALLPDKYPFFADADRYLTMVGPQAQFTRTAGGRFYWLAPVTFTTDAGLSGTDFNVIPAEESGTGYAHVAPTVVTQPELHGGSAVGDLIHCINGRADSWPSAWWWYEWQIDGVTIPNWNREYYRPVAGDVGKALTCVQHWENVEGTITSETAAVNIVDAPVISPSGTVRYIKPSATGTGDGTSWANAASPANVNKMIREVAAGSGTHVLCAAELGDYAPLAFSFMTGPASESARITVIPVNTTTGKYQPAQVTGDRGALTDGGYSLTASAAQGSSCFRVGALNTSYTVNTSTDVFSVSQEFYDQIATGDAVRLSRQSSGIYPAPVAATTAQPGGGTATMVAVYYAIKTATNREIKLASSAANAAAGTAIDITAAPTGTHFLSFCGERADVVAVDTGADTLEVPADFYAKLRNGAVVHITTTGTLPSGINETRDSDGNLIANPFSYWKVRKVGANKVKLYDRTRRADMDTTPETLGSAGTGTLTMWLNMPTKKAQYLTIKGFDFTNVGNGCFVLNQSVGVTIDTVHAVNVYRGFECLNWTNSVGQQDCQTWDLTIKNFHVYGAERGMTRLRYGHLDGQAIDCTCDARYIDGDPFPSLFCLEGELVGTADDGPVRFTYTRCSGKRARRTYGSSEYWNADVFEDNSPSSTITYTDCEASWAADGGFDCKSSNTVYNNCVAAFCKRNFRLWGTGMTLNDCWSLQPQRASEPFGENGGSMHVGVFEFDVIATLNDCFFREAGSVPILSMATTTPDPVITFNNCDFQRRPNTNLFQNDNDATVIYNPAYQTTAPSLTAINATQTSTATASVTCTTNQAGGTLTILAGGDGALFQVTGLTVSSLAPIDPASPTDSNADGVYQVSLRYTNTSGDYTDVTWTLTTLDLTQFPAVTGFTTYNSPSNATSHPIVLPATINAGEEIWLFAYSDGSSITSPAGFTNMPDNSPLPGFRQRECRKIALGSEGGSTVTFTTSVGEKMSILALVLDPRDTAQAPSKQAGESSATATPDPSNATASWGAANNSWLTSIAWDNGNVDLASGATNGGVPTGFTLVGKAVSAAPDGGGVAVAIRNDPSASLNPGAWALSGTAAVYRNTIVVKGT